MTHFQVVVPAYNTERYIKRCLYSIEAQSTYPDFDVLLIDDDSTDSTGKLMNEFAVGAEFPIRVIHNDTNMKMPYNLTYAREGNPEDVILLVDGDDFLPRDPAVLFSLAHHFDDSNLWLTYGSYTRVPDPNYMPNPALDYPDHIKSAMAYRGSVPVYNHPIAFRRHLLNQISNAELQDDDGNWFQDSYDHCIMIPMLELAWRHYKWLPDILYVYNEDNPLSDAKIRPQGGERTHSTINRRPRRVPLP